MLLIANTNIVLMDVLCLHVIDRFIIEISVCRRRQTDKYNEVATRAQFIDRLL